MYGIMQCSMQYYMITGSVVSTFIFLYSKFNAVRPYFTLRFAYSFHAANFIFGDGVQPSSALTKAYPTLWFSISVLVYTSCIITTHNSVDLFPILSEFRALARIHANS